MALVCSGDPGIYAMAALVFELIERGEEPAWARPAITVVPGISALQAAAARAGAPLGRESFFDDRAVRRAATMAQVPCITTLTGASAAVSAIKALRQQTLTVGDEGETRVVDIFEVSAPIGGSYNFV